MEGDGRVGVGAGVGMGGGRFVYTTLMATLGREEPGEVLHIMAAMMVRLPFRSVLQSGLRLLRFQV